MNNHQIIKIGSNCLFDDNNEINYSLLEQKAREIKESDKRTTLVVSGAIALGKKKRGELRNNSELTLQELQMYAGIGQIELINIYQQSFNGSSVSQLLLTYSDLKHKGELYDKVFLDCMHGIYTLINYNDGTDFQGWKHDNDVLAAKLLKFCNSDRLIILGKGYEGLQDKEGNLLERVSTVQQDHYMMCNGNGNHGSGGFKTKLQAAEIVLKEGKEMIIGNIKYGLDELVNGTVKRTLFKQ